MEGRLCLLQKWGELWQVGFGALKTHLMIVWRSPVTVYLEFGGQMLRNANELEILGVIYDKWLTFHQHILKVSKRGAGKIASLRRIFWLNRRTKRPYIISPTHLALLDKVQRRAERIVYGEHPSCLQPLQLRRDVAGMAAMFRIQELKVEHLQELRQPSRPVPRLTREAVRMEHALAVPRCYTLHHQRQFIAVYVRKWNDFMAIEADPRTSSLQGFKIAVNRWLSEPG